MYLRTVTISGFKSYSSSVVLYDLSTFNAITGLNGTGKSNILDAIIFCMNLDNPLLLRVKKLEDLVNKGSNEAIVTLEFIRRKYIDSCNEKHIKRNTLTYENDLKTEKNSESIQEKCEEPILMADIWPVGYESYDVIKVTRSISISGKSKSLLNGHPCTTLTIKKLFASCNLTKNASNIIMQGRITTLLNKCFKTIIEETAGIKQFEEEKLKALSVIESKEEKFNSVKNMLTMSVEPFIERLKEQRHGYLEMIRCEKNLKENIAMIERVDKILELDYIIQSINCIKQNVADYKSASNEMNSVTSVLKENESVDEKIYDVSKSIGENEGKLNIVLGQLKVAEDQQKNLSDKFSVLKKEFGEFKEVDLGISSEIQKINEKMSILCEKEKFILDEIKKSEKASSGIQGQGGFLVEKLEDLEKIKLERQFLIDRIEDLRKKIHQILLENKEINHYINIELSKEKNLQIQDLKNEKENLIANNSAIKIGTDNKNTTFLNNLTSMFNGVNDIEIYKLSSEGLQKMLTACYRKISDLNSVIVTKEEIEKLNTEYNNLKRKLPYPIIKGIHGTVKENFDLLDKKYEIAINTVLGPRLSYIIVENETLGTAVINDRSTGKYNKRVNVIPLNKIKSFYNSKKDRLIHEKGGIRGINAIKFKEEMESAFEYLCGNFYIFENLNDARKICFEFNVTCVSICGNVYDPRGVITGGKAKEYFHNNITLQDINTFKEKLNLMENKFAKSDQYKSEKCVYNEIINLIKSMEESIRKESKIRGKIEFIEAHLNNKSDNNDELLKEVRKELYENEKRKKHLCKRKEDEQKIRNELEKIKNSLNDHMKEKIELEKLLNNDKNKIKEMEIQRGKKEFYEKEKKVLENKRDILRKKIEKIKSLIKRTSEKLMIKIKENYQENEEELIQQVQNWNIEEIYQFTGEKNNENENIPNYQKKQNYNINYEKLNYNNFNSNSVDENKKYYDIKEQNEINVIDFEIPTELENSLKDINQSIFKLKTPENLTQNQTEILKKRVQIAKQEIQSLKKAAPKNMDPKNFDLLEKNEENIKILESKIKRLDEDKEKLKSSLKNISKKGKETFQKAYEHLNKYTSKFLSYFIKDSDIRIDPKTYELSVKIMGTWKNSMKELSGGQRSIVALSVIFAMLKFNPAPFYLFDEIDSALDLSFTQAIGEVIKNEFNSGNRAQFLIVSLKDGMYENADAIYRVCQNEGKNDVKKVK